MEPPASTDVAPRTPTEPDRPRTPRSAVVIGTLALTGTVVSLQQTLVLPLLADFPRLLHTSVDTASWLVTATLLTGAVSIPTMSRLADMFGKKRMMMVALAVMVLGSLVGAVSDAVGFVLTARAMQGVGMALIPIGIAIMRDELPRERVPLGVTLMSATLAVGAGIGLPLSGLIAEHLNWHSIFWVTGVAGALLLVLVHKVLTESPVRTRGAFDYQGAILLSIALTAVMLALSKGAQWGWTSQITLGLAGLGIALLAAWAPLELRARNPLVDVRVATRPGVLLVNLTSLLTGFAMFVNMLTTTLALQAPPSAGYGLGLDVLRTGLWMAPIALTFGALAPVSATAIRRFGPQVTLLTGALVMSGAYLARVYLNHELWQVLGGAMLVAAGISMTYAAMPTLIMRSVPVTETASANGLNTLLRSIGTSAASATVAAVTTMSVVRVGDDVFPSADGLLALFWVAGAASLISALLVLPMLGMREFSTDTPKDAGQF
ncbi:MAG: MFS transporter, partial [Micromonosporaceae bacterium]